MCQILLITVICLGLVGIVYSQDTYSIEEQQALKQFRTAAKGLVKSEYERSDKFLIHWLRAKRLDVQDARKMLAKAKAWRKENRIDEILENPAMLEIMKSYPAEYGVAKDKDGKPAFLYSASTWDFRKGALQGHDWSKVTSYQLERMSKVAESTNQSQYLYIDNMNLYNLRQHACVACMPYYIEVVSQYENYYPNHAKVIFLFNSPSVFEPILKLIRSLMTPLTRESMKVFGHDKAEWQPELLKYFHPNQLTRAFGGTKHSN